MRAEYVGLMSGTRVDAVLVHLSSDWPALRAAHTSKWDSGLRHGILAEFTVTGIVGALMRFCTPVEKLYVCGGGAHNRYLM